MIILSIDSSTPVAGVAVADGEQLLGEIFLNTKNTHLEKLLPLIRRCCRIWNYLWRIWMQWQ